jgi:hypothetical protein
LFTLAPGQLGNPSQPLFEASCLHCRLRCRQDSGQTADQLNSSRSSTANDDSVKIFMAALHRLAVLGVLSSWSATAAMRLALKIL